MLVQVVTAVGHVVGHFQLAVVVMGADLFADRVASHFHKLYDVSGVLSGRGGLDLIGDLLRDVHHLAVDLAGD